MLRIEFRMTLIWQVLRKILLIIIFLSLLQCETEESRELIPWEKEKRERKENREKELKCLFYYSTCFNEPGLRRISPEDRNDICIRQGYVWRPCLGLPLF